MHTGSNNSFIIITYVRDPTFDLVVRNAERARFSRHQTSIYPLIGRCPEAAQPRARIVGYTLVHTGSIGYRRGIWGMMTCIFLINKLLKKATAVQMDYRKKLTHFIFKHFNFLPGQKTCQGFDLYDDSFNLNFKI